MEVVAMMCLIATSDASGLPLLDYPTYQAQVIGGVDYGEWVTFNLSDRSGMWAEVTDSEGETGWVEIGYLDCQSQ